MSVSAARWLLDNGLCDVRQLDLDGFRGWLEGRVDRWAAHPVYQQRTRIRDLRCSHPSLLALEADYRQAREVYRASEHYPRFRQLRAALRGVGQAVAGLAAAGKLEKLATFQLRQEQLRREMAELTAASPQRRALLAVRKRWRAISQASGLAQEEQVLRKLLRESGRGTGSRGKAFEQAALDYAAEKLAPRLKADRIFRGLTLAAPDTELDIVLVQVRSEHARVVGVIEAKRNANDLAHGYRQRTRNLRWFNGKGEVKPTGYYRSGRFDRPYKHDGLIFDRDSFEKTPLILLTRPGPIWGMSSQTQSRLSHRVSTDLDFCWDDAYLARLRDWLLALTAKVETPDLLRQPRLKLAILES